MALARIITHHPEDAAEVRDALQRRGYWVEIVSPAEIADSPAELEISLDRASLEQALATARDSGVPILLAPGAVTEPARETSQPVSVPPEPSAVAETPPPVQAPPAEPFVAAEIATEPFAAAEEASAELLTDAEEIEAEPSDSFEARHRERQAARRSHAVLTQNSRAPVAAPISSDLVWHSRTATPTELPRPTRPRSGRQRDWEIALAGGALAASLLMLAFGLFGTQGPDSQVSAASPALKQKTARVSATSTSTLSHPKTSLSPSAALPQSDQPVSGTGPVQQPPVKRSRSAENSGPDDYGEEVVVRHFTPVKPVRTGDGVKHISDGN